MYVIEKMRLNKFQPKPIVTNRALFICKGAQEATVQSKDTADCYSEPTTLGASKTKVLGLAQNVVNSAIAKAKEGEKAPDMQQKNAKEF